MLFLSYAELHSEPLRNRSIINLENKCFGIPHYLCSHISSKCITSVFIRVKPPIILDRLSMY